MNMGNNTLVNSEEATDDPELYLIQFACMRGITSLRPPFMAISSNEGQNSIYQTSGQENMEYNVSVYSPDEHILKKIKHMNPSDVTQEISDEMRDMGSVLMDDILHLDTDPLGRLENKMKQDMNITGSRDELYRTMWDPTTRSYDPGTGVSLVHAVLSEVMLASYELKKNEHHESYHDKANILKGAIKIRQLEHLQKTRESYDYSYIDEYVFSTPCEPNSKYQYDLENVKFAPDAGWIKYEGADNVNNHVSNNDGDDVKVYQADGTEVVTSSTMFTRIMKQLIKSDTIHIGKDPAFQKAPDDFGESAGYVDNVPVNINTYGPGAEYLVPYRIEMAMQTGISCIMELEQMQCEESYINLLSDSSSEERRAIFGTGMSVEDANMDRRASVWNDVLREINISGDRLYTFVRDLTGAISEDVKSAISWEDDELKAVSKSMKTKQNELNDKLFQSQSRLIENMITSTIRSSNLKLDMLHKNRSKGGFHVDDLVVVPSDVKENIRQVMSGEESNGFFESYVRLHSDLGIGNQPIPIREVISKLQNVAMQTMTDAKSNNVSDMVASYSRIVEPRNSYMISMKPDVVSAINTSFQFLKSALKHSDVAISRMVTLWELIEGKDKEMSVMFARLVGKVLQNTRMTSGNFSSYVNPQVLRVNTIISKEELKRLSEKTIQYLCHNRERPKFLENGMRSVYFGGHDRVSTPQRTHDPNMYPGGGSNPDPGNGPGGDRRPPKSNSCKKEVEYYVRLLKQMQKRHDRKWKERADDTTKPSKSQKSSSHRASFAEAAGMIKTIVDQTTELDPATFSLFVQSVLCILAANGEMFQHSHQIDLNSLGISVQSYTQIPKSVTFPKSVMNQLFGSMTDIDYISRSLSKNLYSLFNVNGTKLPFYKFKETQSDDTVTFEREELRHESKLLDLIRMFSTFVNTFLKSIFNFKKTFTVGMIVVLMCTHGYNKGNDWLNDTSELCNGEYMSAKQCAEWHSMIYNKTSQWKTVNLVAQNLIYQERNTTVEIVSSLDTSKEAPYVIEEAGIPFKIQNDNERNNFLEMSKSKTGPIAQGYEKLRDDVSATLYFKLLQLEKNVNDNFIGSSADPILARFRQGYCLRYARKVLVDSRLKYDASMKQQYDALCSAIQSKVTSGDLDFNIEDIKSQLSQTDAQNSLFFKISNNSDFTDTRFTPTDVNITKHGYRIIENMNNADRGAFLKSLENMLKNVQSSTISNASIDDLSNTLGIVSNIRRPLLYKLIELGNSFESKLLDVATVVAYTLQQQYDDNLLESGIELFGFDKMMEIKDVYDDFYIKIFANQTNIKDSYKKIFTQFAESKAEELLSNYKRLPSREQSTSMKKHLIEILDTAYSILRRNFKDINFELSTSIASFAESIYTKSENEKFPVTTPLTNPMQNLF